MKNTITATAASVKQFSIDNLKPSTVWRLALVTCAVFWVSIFSILVQAFA